MEIPAKIQGRVFIHEYATQCRIGCSELERMSDQPILVDVECQTDMRAAVSADDRTACIDYCQIRQFIEEAASRSSYQLLERLAYAIATETLDLLYVDSVTVTIRKPYKLAGLRDVGISLTLHKQEG